MAAVLSQSQHSQPSSSTASTGSNRAQEEEGEESSDELTMSTDPHSELLIKFNKILQKALHHTFQQITGKLLSEVRDVGQRTAELESQMDDMQGQINKHSRVLEALKEENLNLNAKIEDAENRSRRVNLRLRGISKNNN